MNIALLERKVGSLSAVQQESVESYIDFLIYKNEEYNPAPKMALDFSKYNTATHLWKEDAQEFVRGLRDGERF